MRRWHPVEAISPFLTLSSFALKRSYSSRPRIIKHLSNAELLDVVHEANGDAASTPQETRHGPSNQLPQPLPSSPLNDPRLIAARHRYRTPKPIPSEKRSAFQRKLEHNPYGMPFLLFTYVAIAD